MFGVIIILVQKSLKIYIRYMKDIPLTMREWKFSLKLVINAGIKKIVYIEGYNMENEVKKDLLNESGLIIIPLNC